MDSNRITSLQKPPRLKRGLKWLALLLILGAGSMLRFQQIGTVSLWTDEYFHVVAAQSNLKDGSLYVPTKGQYRRSKPITYLTVISFKLFGVSEASARLPFAAINVLFILLAFLVLERFFSTTIAFIFCVVMAFSPFAIKLSMECRMYTLLQLLYFAMSFAFFRAFEPEPQEERFSLDLRWLMASLALGLASVVVQPITVNFFFTAFSYLVLSCCLLAAKNGFSSALKSKYGVFIVMIFAGLAAAYILKPEAFALFWYEAKFDPSWSTETISSATFYRYFLSDSYPALFYLYPLGALCLILRYEKRGWFAVLSFAVPFALHSYLYMRKGDRYVFYIFPFFVLGAVAALEAMGRGIWRLLKENLGIQTKVSAAALAFCLVPALNVIGNPWLSQSRHVADQHDHPDWKDLPAETRRKISSSRVITTNPLNFLYYFGRMPDYYVTDEFDPKYTYEPGLIRTPGQMREAILSSSNTCFLTTEWYLNNDGIVSPEIRNEVLSRMEREKHGGEPRIWVLYRKKGTRP